MPDLTYTLFATDVAILVVLLAGVLWSIAVPEKRIWPPPRRRSWQWVLTWTCCSAVYGLNVALFFLDWNAWLFPSYLRIVAGIPTALLGGLNSGFGRRRADMIVVSVTAIRAGGSRSPRSRSIHGRLWTSGPPSPHAP